MLCGNGVDVGVIFARLLADFVRLAAAVVLDPLANPVWVRWDHAEPGSVAGGCADI